MQYPSKKAKRKAEFIKREAQRQWYKTRDQNIQRALYSGNIEDMVRAMGVKLK
jgi:hypothetical protein